MQTNGLWYFAHPYTVRDAQGNYVPEAEEANFRLCCYRAGQLLMRGYNVYSPIAHTHPIHMATVEFLRAHEHKLWYQLDREFIGSVNWIGLILAPKWGASDGCQMEYRLFMEMISVGRTTFIWEYETIMQKPIIYEPGE